MLLQSSAVKTVKFMTRVSNLDKLLLCWRISTANPLASDFRLNGHCIFGNVAWLKNGLIGAQQLKVGCHGLKEFQEDCVWEQRSVLQHRYLANRFRRASISWPKKKKIISLGANEFTVEQDWRWAKLDGSCRVRFLEVAWSTSFSKNFEVVAIHAIRLKFLELILIQT